MELLYALLQIPIGLLWSYENGYRIGVKNKNINHPFEWTLRVLVAVAVTLVAFRINPFSVAFFTDFLFTKDAIQATLLTVIQGFIFWLIIDPMVNVFRFKDWSRWNYIGKTATQDEKLQDWKMTAGLWMSLKVCVMVILIMIYHSAYLMY